MAIDFSQVKTITIPEGSVTKITDSNGNILWKEQPNNWHTIWEGNKTIKYTPGYGTEGASYSFASTANGTGFAPRLRITFSFSNGSKYSSNDYFKYYKGSYITQDEKPTSPLEVDVINNNGTQILGIEQVSPYKFRAESSLYKNNDTSNNRVTFDLKGDGFSDISSSSRYYVSMTITKIEQYYE